MPVLAGVVLVIQFCFAFHVLKTGRPYWWMFIIMAFPVMGCVIYYFVEVFPGSREHRKARRTARQIARALQPDAEIKRRAEELEICGSAENKIAMAEECTLHGMHAEAVKLYESCLHGAFRNDPAILYGLARAAVDLGDWDKAATAIAALESAKPDYRRQEVRLLAARTLEGRGQNDAALAAYRELVGVYVGLEARYRYADFLARLGQHESAGHMFNEVIKHAKRFASSLEDEQHWVEAARDAVANAGSR